MDSKLALGIFLVGFWLFLPIPMLLLDMTGFNTVKYETANQNSVTVGLTGINLYFKLLFFSIPDVPVIIKYFINFLQICTLLFLFFAFRGD